MNKNELESFNDFFSKIKEVTKIKQFQFNSETKNAEGEITILTKKGEVIFFVEIPETYPLNNLHFKTKGFIGYPHQNFDGSLCLNTSFVNNAITRLNLEIEKLLNYITKYYEEDYEDETYEYSALEANGKVTLLYDENNFDKTRFKIPFGDFKYTVTGTCHDEKNKVSQITALAQNIGNKSYSWSNAYKKKDTYIGLWVFLESEPVQNKKLRYKNWQELSPKLPKEFSEYFKAFCKRSPNYKLTPKGLDNFILLSVGYKIPNGTEWEVTWDLILMPRYDFPRKFSFSKQLLSQYDKPILWDNSFNISYDRYFGRGSIENDLALKKTLIIGNGAIGSSLAEILTRGGATKIDLADPEPIEPGNICRSIYTFADISFSKLGTLKEKLQNISPYIEVNIFDNLSATSIKTNNGKEIKDKLSKYEIIFDCTANNEIIQMLTDFELVNTVFYISISNKANEMICVCNHDNKNLIERRNQMLYSFGNFKEAEYREGTGCWHPTFEASFFDINQLLNYTLKKINSYYKKGIAPKSFYTKFKDDEISSSEDIKYFQKELNLYLTIESSCIKKIETNSRLHFPNEYGGILIGSYLNGYKELVISDIICPDKFKSDKERFEPDHNDLNKKLKTVYNDFDGMIEYLGDWHTHPNSKNMYSESDFNSIQDIAKSKNVNTHNPILLIVALGKDYFDPGFYVYEKEMLYKFKRI